MSEYANNISLLICNAENIFKGFQVFMVAVQIMVSLFFGGAGVGYMSMCLVKALSHPHYIALIGQNSLKPFGITDTFFPFHLLQHLLEPDSVTLKMEAGHSSETLGHTFTTRCENPQNDH